MAGLGNPRGLYPHQEAALRHIRERGEQTVVLVIDAGERRSQREALLRSLEAHDIACREVESLPRDTIVLRAPEPFVDSDFILRPEALDRGPIKHNKKGRQRRW